VFITKKVSFNGTEKDQQEPSECKTHVHIAKLEVGLENFLVDQAFEKDLLQAMAECPAKETALKPQLVRA